jgi:hypothetical protein
MQTAATWLFVFPLFTEGVAKDVVKAEIAGLALLAFARIVVSDRVLPRLAVERIFMTLGVLALIGIAYQAFRPWPSDAGTAHSYDTHALIFGGTVVAVAVFAVLFFEEELFARVIWRGATVALWIGVASCAASRLTGHLLLVNANHGLRMVGTLTEPSDWAPVLVIVVLLALRRRSWLYMALALAGLVLADSPTCLLVMAVTVPLYYALTSSRRHRVPLLVILAIIIPAGALFVQRADAAAWLDSGNPAKIAVGRLVSGIHNVETGGEVGTNVRFQSATVVIAATREHGWMHFGAGPAADSTWLSAMYPDAAGGATVAANALWIAFLFDYGEAGVAVLAAMMIVAVWRMRRNPQMTAILLPFFIAQLVNSSGADTALVALGIMLFTFGWAPRASRSPAAAAGRRESPFGLPPAPGISGPAS